MRWISLSALIACGGDVSGTVIIDTDTEDTEGPEIQHVPITEPQVYGKDIWLEATATDEQSSVWLVMVMYQPETANEWQDMPLNEVVAGFSKDKLMAVMSGPVECGTLLRV